MIKRKKWKMPRIYTIQTDEMMYIIMSKNIANTKIDAQSSG